ncbi:MAG: Gfo/Idh/MocA family oxidoreductase [Phycisphaerae bacterium]|nr:Gfo/Idh/MocA family oxidoreductase [Phycisphaerae bacterium]
MSPIRIGVLGEGATAEAWLRAVAGNQNARLAVLSDSDADRAASLAAHYATDCEKDHRTLLVQHALDAAVFAMSPAAAERLLPIAAQRSVAVLLDTPPARTLDEAVRRVALFDKARRPLLVASDWRFDPAPIDAVANACGRIFHAAAVVTAPFPADLEWRGDRVRAGGGALINAAYVWLDLLVHLMGLPSDVVTQMGRLVQPPDLAYDAEDTACALLRYADGRSATITAAWGRPPSERVLTLRGADDLACLTLDMAPSPLARGVAALIAACGASAPADPNCAHHQTAPPGESDDVPSDSPETLAPTPPPSTLEAHLKTIAVTQAAYLSARTGAPESPHVLLERAGRV